MNLYVIYQPTTDSYLLQASWAADRTEKRLSVVADYIAALPTEVQVDGDAKTVGILTDLWGIACTKSVWSGMLC